MDFNSSSITSELFKIKNKNTDLKIENSFLKKRIKILKRKAEKNLIIMRFMKRRAKLFRSFWCVNQKIKCFYKKVFFSLNKIFKIRVSLTNLILDFEKTTEKIKTKI